MIRGRQLSGTGDSHRPVMIHRSIVIRRPFVRLEVHYKGVMSVAALSSGPPNPNPGISTARSLSAETLTESPRLRNPGGSRRRIK
jgi:hypothetical protein